MSAMVQTQHKPTDVMTCGECRRLTDWNPVGFCSWTCYEARPRDPASTPPAHSYFFGLGSPTALAHPRNP
ncbi:hypothetical protein [Kitasatospora sp. NPDC057015]|uniref:hypothetical protein n=1 Tax=Kitasatospora sp. NPDC057015 TaxID=3346001 RepID=UPI003635D5D1